MPTMYVLYILEMPFGPSGFRTALAPTARVPAARRSGNATCPRPGSGGKTQCQGEDEQQVSEGCNCGELGKALCAVVRIL